MQLASDRAFLTEKAGVALDAELSRRKLGKSHLFKHQQFVKRNERREFIRRRRKAFGSSQERASWVDKFVVLFWSAVVMSLITLTYQAIPSRYHFTPDWQEAAVIVMFASVFLAVASNFWWRNITFWISLAISSATHFVLVHVWIIRTGTLTGRRGEGKLAILLGPVLFVLLYGCGWLLRQKFYAEEITEE